MLSPIFTYCPCFNESFSICYLPVRISAFAICFIHVLQESKCDIVLWNVAFFVTQFFLHRKEYYYGNNANLTRIQEELQGQEDRNGGISTQIQQAEARIQEIEAQLTQKKTELEQLQQELAAMTANAPPQQGSHF